MNIEKDCLILNHFRFTWVKRNERSWGPKAFDIRLEHKAFDALGDSYWEPVSGWYVNSDKLDKHPIKDPEELALYILLINFLGLNQ